MSIMARIRSGRSGWERPAKCLAYARSVTRAVFSIVDSAIRYNDDLTGTGALFRAPFGTIYRQIEPTPSCFEPFGNTADPGRSPGSSRARADAGSHPRRGPDNARTARRK